MKKPTGARQDIPGTRQLIHTVATKVNIYFLLGIALCGGIVFGVSLLAGGGQFLDTAPEPAVMMIVGFLCFALFFPWFMTLYLCRHLLCSVEKLEAEVAELKGISGK